jgi:hypothetical protein
LSGDWHPANIEAESDGPFFSNALMMGLREQNFFSDAGVDPCGSHLALKTCIRNWNSPAH